MKIGILGIGGIAHAAAKTLQAVEKAELWSVGSRDKEKAQRFAQQYGFARAYGSYAEMLSDPELELVYIATPHSHHYEYGMMALRCGKHVLCEKAFTMNARQAKEMRDYAKEHKLFLAEAIWTRYQPSRKIIDDAVASGIIGNPTLLTANLSEAIYSIPRLHDPNLGGGALLDVGVYGINFALMHFGDEVERVDSTMQLAPSGVDGQESITICFKDGKMAVLTHGLFSHTEKKCIIYGDKGSIVVDSINNPHNMKVYDLWEHLVQDVDMPEQVTGYEYEYREVIDAIEAGLLEAPSMPLSETVFIMELMDSIRESWGLRFPCE